MRKVVYIYCKGELTSAVVRPDKAVWCQCCGKVVKGLGVLR